MEFDELKELVISGQIQAITLDTSIFNAHGLKLGSGLLKQLEQFKESSTRLIISEIVYEEVLLHLTQKIKEIEKSLKHVKDYFFVEEEKIDEFEELIFDERDAEKIASDRFRNFIKLTSIEIIKAQDLVKIDSLIKAYFKALPPFSETGKKKHEFPDAIALFSLEEWAIKRQKKVIVVTRDEDWKRFCQKSQNLFNLDDFAKALSLFQLQSTNDICKHLSERYEKDDLPLLQDNVFEALYQLENIEIVPDAISNSSLFFDRDWTEITVNDFEFKILEAPNLIFRPINFIEDVLVVESKLTVDVNIGCSFSFYLLDSEGFEMPMGNTSVSTQTILDVNILISFTGNLDQVGAEVEIENIELETKETIYVDFGDIDPDFED